ncbi:glycosyltransferase [Krasilnikovia sp. MM14-A1004]|uniref:glycosyltransferase n=1 Tax=Krasilnikovia sp. MM14-A1004 TaxID=3373541 RepID=UPI00399CFFD9
MPAQTLRLVPPPVRLSDAPAPSWAQIARLSDDTGLLGHASTAIPRREQGYRVADAARGLLVASRDPRPNPQVVGLAERYVAFLLHAQSPDGAFHGRLGYDRRWLDEPSTGEPWGHAMWGLGTAAARSTVPWIRQGAADAFRLGARLRSARPRAMALAGLGAAEVLRADPRADPAADLLADAATVVGLPGVDPSWAWPEPELTYANPALAEVVVAAGDLLGDEALFAEGLRMLAWLCGVQEHDGHLSPVPDGGLRPETPGTRHADNRNGTDSGRSTNAPGCSSNVPADSRNVPADSSNVPADSSSVLADSSSVLADSSSVLAGSTASSSDAARGVQRPAEAAATADACATAVSVTGDAHWDVPLFQAVAWFLGDNDTGKVMYDPVTGGCFDALTPDGPEHHQGAEATLALLSTLQHARALAARQPRDGRTVANSRRRG